MLPRRMANLTREALREGARLFDEGAFFDAHEAWEQRWRVETDEASRRLLQGLIQIAAAFHKLFVMHDSASASRLLERGLAKLEGCAEVGEFREAIRACANRLGGGVFDASTVPRLAMGASRA